MPSAPRLPVMTIALFLASSMLSVQAEPLIYATGGGVTDLLAIDAKTGETKVIGSFGYPGSALLAFGADGTLYTVTDSMRHENSRSQLATVDPAPARRRPLESYSTRRSGSWLWGPDQTEVCTPAA
jgi:hypothetical protein